MKLLLLVACACVVLAGCAGSSPSTSGSATNTSGTATSTNPDGGNNGFAPHQGIEHSSANNIDLDVRWRACAEGFCANATATNTGTATYQVSSICVSPWEDRMTHEGAPVTHRESMAVCAAYGRAPFGPDDKATNNFVWDATLFDEATGRSSPAPEGAYTWTIVFWYESNEGGGRMETTTDIHLIIGET